jgi:hypothetical protein
LVEAEDVHVAVVSFDFDVAIPRSIPLVDNFDDGYPTLAPIKSLRRLRMRVSLNYLADLTIGAAPMSAIPPKADIVRHGGDVRFVPILLQKSVAGLFGQ